MLLGITWSGVNPGFYFLGNIFVKNNISEKYKIFLLKKKKNVILLLLFLVGKIFNFKYTFILLSIMKDLP